LKGISGLILLVVFGGRLLMWLIFPVPYFICLPLLLKNITLFVVILGIYIGYELSKFSLRFNNNSLINLDSSLYFSGMWNIPFLSTFGINYFPLFMGNYIYKNIDQGWSEYFGRQNIYNNIKSLSQSLFYYYNNNLKIYLLLFIFWILFLFIYF
jgi:NADH-ubiquinone oxidoreductase chain 5